jgi:predicted outer membrane repeat protein
MTLNDTVAISRNTAQYGGGIYNGGTVTFIFRATVSDNTARGFGGGIRNLGTLNSAYAGINVFGNTPDDVD